MAPGVRPACSGRVSRAPGRRAPERRAAEQRAAEQRAAEHRARMPPAGTPDRLPPRLAVRAIAPAGRGRRAAAASRWPHPSGRSCAVAALTGG
jgi:hypothetical protein